MWRSSFVETCEVLGVSRNSTDQEIKSVYRKMALKDFPGIVIAEEPEWKDCIQGSNAVVNLAGMPISTIWSPEVRREGSNNHRGSQWHWRGHRKTIRVEWSVCCDCRHSRRIGCSSCGFHRPTQIQLQALRREGRKHVEEIVAFAIEKYGTLDIMHSNAGIMGPVGSILDMDMDAFDNTISAASELGKHGIRVNCVSPSGLATGLVSASGVKNMDKSAIEALATALANLKGIVLNANHVVEAVLFLASDESVYVSGHNLAVDGGVSVVNTAMTMMKR
ncbi:hypothetical protein ACSBR2_031607 [Camellia fascicularis]